MANPQIEDREQSIAQLFRELSQETTGLVREELERLRDDLTQQGKQLGASATLLVAAGSLGLGAFGALTAGLVAAFGRGRPGRGALVVAGLYGAGATGLALLARDRLSRAVPETVEAVDSVRRDAEAAAEGARAAS